MPATSVYMGPIAAYSGVEITPRAAVRVALLVLVPVAGSRMVVAPTVPVPYITCSRKRLLALPASVRRTP